MSNSEPAIMMPTRDDRHLDESLLAGFLDGDLEAEALDRAVTHLDACAECRAELGSVRELARSLSAQPRARSHRAAIWTMLGGILAASLAGVALIRQPTRANQEIAARSRAIAEGTARIEVVSPGPLVLRPGAATFVWRSAAVDVYRFTLQSENGAVLVSRETSDTTLAWPREVTAVPGASHFWRVDGIAGTITASTGARRLRLAP